MAVYGNDAFSILVLLTKDSTPFSLKKVFVSIKFVSKLSLLIAS